MRIIFWDYDEWKEEKWFFSFCYVKKRKEDYLSDGHIDYCSQPHSRHSASIHNES